MLHRLVVLGVLGAIIAGIFYFGIFASVMRAACQPEPITVNTPTGIAGCHRWGAGTASHYGPGSGVAMNFCTWELRHGSGCGSVRITSQQTGRTVIAPVIDFCDCYTGTARERIVDLQYDVVRNLGLDLAQGLYPVIVEPADRTPPSTEVPDTSMTP